MPRTFIILAASIRLGWRLLRARSEAPPLRAELLRATLEELGTTFVKIGQALSLRWDLLPDDVRAVLSRLQHDVAPFPSAVAVAEIETAFGQPIERLFAAFEREPMAAASVAQVHRATLADGTDVIVKVRRPGIEALVHGDLRVLRRLARVAQTISARAARLQPVALIDELQEQLLAEIDLAHEARNIRRLGSALRNRPDVWLPEVIAPWVSSSVVVQQFSPGLPVSRVFGTEEGRRLAGVLIDAYLFQLFVAGAYHADPHPGNLFVLPDGRLCFHDFGLIGTLDGRSRRALAQLLGAVAIQNATDAVDAAVDLGVLVGEFDRPAYERAMDGILSDLATAPLGEWSLAEAVMRIARLGRGEDFRVPRHLLVLVRTLYLLESTARQLDPELQLADALLARTDAFVRSERSAIPRSMSRRAALAEALRASRDVPLLLAHWLRRARNDDGLPAFTLRHRGLEPLDTTIARTGNRLALALVTLGAYIAASLLMLHSAGPRIFGDLPIIALVAYAIALVLTGVLVRAIMRSGHL